MIKYCAVDVILDLYNFFKCNSIYSELLKICLFITYLHINSRTNISLHAGCQSFAVLCASSLIHPLCYHRVKTSSPAS